MIRKQSQKNIQIIWKQKENNSERKDEKNNNNNKHGHLDAPRFMANCKNFEKLGDRRLFADENAKNGSGNRRLATHSAQ